MIKHLNTGLFFNKKRNFQKKSAVLLMMFNNVYLLKKNVLSYCQIFVITYSRNSFDTYLFNINEIVEERY